MAPQLDAYGLYDVITRFAADARDTGGFIVDDSRSKELTQQCKDLDDIVAVRRRVFAYVRKADGWILVINRLAIN
jgi:hypothetical protein